MPENTVYVGRPTKWGNPFTVGARTVWAGGRKVQDNRHAVALFRGAALQQERLVEAAQTELRGKNLACWCPLDQPCHADVLLELANT